MCKLNNKSQKHFKYYFLNQKKTKTKQFNCTGNFTTKAINFLYKIPLLGIANNCKSINCSQLSQIYHFCYSNTLGT